MVVGGGGWWWWGWWWRGVTGRVVVARGSDGDADGFELRTRTSNASQDGRRQWQRRRWPAALRSLGHGFVDGKNGHFNGFPQRATALLHQ